MQIKSWQIALIGVIIFGLVSIFTMKRIGELNFNPLILGTIACLLLYLEKTRKIGSVISIIFGLLTFIYIYQRSGITWYFFSTYGLDALAIVFLAESFLGITFLISGIHYFWKKV